MGRDAVQGINNVPSALGLGALEMILETLLEITRGNIGNTTDTRKPNIRHAQEYFSSATLFVILLLR